MGEFRVHHVRFFEYCPSAVHCLAYENSQQKLAVSRSDGCIEVWNLKENWLQEKVFPPPEGKSVEALLWVKGRLFSAGLHGNLYEHDVVTGLVKNTASSNSGPIWCLALNDDQSQIAAGTEDGCVVLFDVTDSSVYYGRALDKQEGRILSMAWYSPDNLIVTGGIDNLRVWSLKSGHAIQRLTLGRQERNKETIVWAVAVTSDFTIVSGDSRGKTCFWNGRQGALLKSFQSHKADVLTICVNTEGTTVFSSGIDPALTQFEYISSNPSSDLKIWVRSSVRMQHSHDVRAVTFAKDGVVSGGVDCRLIFNSLEGKAGVKPWRTIPAIPQAPLVHTAKTAHMVLLRYWDSLELWTLGRTTAKSVKNGEFLKLDSSPVKLVQLTSRDNEYITCSAVSHDAHWVAYADQYKLRIFQVIVEENLEVGYPKVSINKIRSLPPGVQTPISLLFSPDGNTLLSATSTGDVQIIKMDAMQPILENTLSLPDKGVNVQPSSLSVLSVSSSGKYVGTADINGCVHVYRLKRAKHLVTLPKYSHQPTAIAFHPKLKLIAVAYSNQIILEYDLSALEYTDWSRKHMQQFPKYWQKHVHKIRQIMYNPQNPEQIVVRDAHSFCILDKTQPFPDIHADPSKQSHKTDVKHAFHACNKFKYLLHLDILEDDFLLVVERPPLALLDSLPPTLKQKKFGT